MMVTMDGVQEMDIGTALFLLVRISNKNIDLGQPFSGHRSIQISQKL